MFFIQDPPVQLTLDEALYASTVETDEPQTTTITIQVEETEDD